MAAAHLKLKDSEDPEENDALGKGTPIRVDDILKENLTRALGQKQVDEAEKPIEFNAPSNRKRRDYLLLLLVNCVLIAPIFILGADMLVLVASLTAAFIYTVGLSWIMWIVLSDY